MAGRDWNVGAPLHPPYKSSILSRDVDQWSSRVVVSMYITDRDIFFLVDYAPAPPGREPKSPLRPLPRLHHCDSLHPIRPSQLEHR
jgi:hypothetical protein